MPTEAEAEIMGAPEKHVKAGSILRLVCILHYTTESPAYVFWYRGNQMINYNEEQSVVVESDEHTSVLLVTRADRHHSGNYTCLPSNAKPASILVHILNGELGEQIRSLQGFFSYTSIKFNDKNINLHEILTKISIILLSCSLNLHLLSFLLKLMKYYLFIITVLFFIKHLLSS